MTENEQRRREDAARQFLDVLFVTTEHRDITKIQAFREMCRFELKALRWRDVALVEGVLRVRVSKSEEGERTIALSPALVAALEAHYQRTAFKGDDELVFCHPGPRLDDRRCLVGGPVPRGAESGRD